MPVTEALDIGEQGRTRDADIAHTNDDLSLHRFRFSSRFGWSGYGVHCPGRVSA
jgi:hypothetical protein